MSGEIKIKEKKCACCKKTARFMQLNVIIFILHETMNGNGKEKGKFGRFLSYDMENIFIALYNFLLLNLIGL